MMEVAGVPMPVRARIIKLFYRGAVIMAVYMLLVGVFLVNPEHWYYTIPFIVFLSGISLVIAESFAHRERRDSSTMILDVEGIQLSNDWIDMIMRRSNSIAYDMIEYISVHDRPTDEGYEPHFLIIHTDDGKKISSGAKEADGLRKAVTMLEAEGIRVEEVL